MCVSHDQFFVNAIATEAWVGAFLRLNSSSLAHRHTVSVSVSISHFLSLSFRAKIQSPPQLFSIVRLLVAKVVGGPSGKVRRVESFTAYRDAQMKKLDQRLAAAKPDPKPEVKKVAPKASAAGGKTAPKTATKK